MHQYYSTSFFWRPFGSKRLNNCFKMFPQVIGSTMVLGLEFGKAECLDLCVESKYQTFVFEAITCSTPERQWPHYLTPALKWRLGWRFTTLERQMKQCHAVPLALPNRFPANRASDPSKWLWRCYWDGGMWLYVIHGFAWTFRIPNLFNASMIWFLWFLHSCSPAIQPPTKHSDVALRSWRARAARLTCLGYKHHLHLGLNCQSVFKDSLRCVFQTMFSIAIFFIFTICGLPKTSAMNRCTLMHSSVQDHFKDASEAMVAMSEHRRFVQVRRMCSSRQNGDIGWCTKCTLKLVLSCRGKPCLWNGSPTWSTAIWFYKKLFSVGVRTSWRRDLL